MPPDIAKIGSTEQSITDGMDQNIGIGVANGTFVVLNQQPSEP